MIPAKSSSRRWSPGEGLDGRSFPAGPVQQWWVEALTKVVGINSIDDLTRTRTSLEFTRTPNSVFGGGNTGATCWGNHFPSPPFYYYVDDCRVNAFDFDGPSSVFIRLKGIYTNSLVPSFGHWTTAKAEGTVTTDRAVCAGGSLPIGPSDLECELDSGPVD